MQDNVIRESLKRAYNFELEMPTVEFAGISGSVICKFCQDIKFGRYSMNDLSTMRTGPFKASYAGKMDIPDLQLSFLSPSTGIVENFFVGWGDAILDKEGYYYPKQAYAKTMYISLLDTAGHEGEGGRQYVLKRYRLCGCFPKTYPNYNLSYSSDGLIKHDVTMNVDLIEEE